MPMALARNRVIELLPDAADAAFSMSFVVHRRYDHA